MASFWVRGVSAYRRQKQVVGVFALLEEGHSRLVSWCFLGCAVGLYNINLYRLPSSEGSPFFPKLIGSW